MALSKGSSPSYVSAVAGAGVSGPCYSLSGSMSSLLRNVSSTAGSCHKAASPVHLLLVHSHPVTSPHHQQPVMHHSITIIANAYLHIASTYSKESSCHGQYSLNTHYYLPKNHNKMPDYMPHSESEMMLWLNNFSTKLSMHSATVGLLPADVTATTTASTQLSLAFNQLEQARTNVKSLSSGKDNLKALTTAQVRKLVSRIKASNGYSESIGQDLGIIGTATDVDLDNSKPTLKGEVFPGYVRNIVFQKAIFRRSYLYKAERFYRLGIPGAGYVQPL